MRTVLYLVLTFSCLGCFTNKRTVIFESHLNPEALALEFIDSLKTAETDTLVAYYDGCSGCMTKLQNVYYVCWVENGMTHLTKFTTLANFNNLKRGGLPIGYLLSSLDSIKAEKLIEPNYWISHYGYETLIIVHGDREVIYTIKDFEKHENEGSLHAIAIDKFRSFLLDIPEYDWKGTNYKIKQK